MTKKLSIFRYSFDQQGICGRLYENDKIICSTLERPDFKNISDDPKTLINESSCIPAGFYKVKLTYSPRHKRDLFEILNVPSRNGIRFDIANNIDQLLGCIAVGASIIENYKYKDKLYKYWITSSGATMSKLFKDYPDGFDLEIK